MEKDKVDSVCNNAYSRKINQGTLYIGSLKVVLFTSSVIIKCVGMKAKLGRVH